MYVITNWPQDPLKGFRVRDPKLSGSHWQSDIDGFCFCTFFCLFLSLVRKRDTLCRRIDLGKKGTLLPGEEVGLCFAVLLSWVVANARIFICSNMGDSVSRSHNVNHPIRRSLRLKHVRVIYEENGVEVIGLSAASEKHKKECDPFVGKQVKGMMLESEDDGFACKSSGHVDTLSDSVSDEQSAIGITLKDLRKRCKARKRKAPKCNFSSEVDSGCHSTSGESKMRNHEHVKLEQEESDLEEPLIKLKRLKGSARDKKRPKRAHLCSDDIDSKVDTLSPCRFCDPVQDLSPVVKANASTKGRVSEDDAAEVDVKNTAGEVSTCRYSFTLYSP